MKAKNAKPMNRRIPCSDICTFFKGFLQCIQTLFGGDSERFCYFDDSLNHVDVHSFPAMPILFDSKGIQFYTHFISSKKHRPPLSTFQTKRCLRTSRLAREVGLRCTSQRPRAAWSSWSCSFPPKPPWTSNR